VFVPERFHGHLRYFLAGVFLRKLNLSLFDWRKSVHHGCFAVAQGSVQIRLSFTAEISPSTEYLGRALPTVLTRNNGLL
jgi:hypothetical protein